jgi:crossover junction endodeoxyribonuclease RuvC
VKIASSKSKPASATEPPIARSLDRSTERPKVKGKVCERILGIDPGLITTGYGVIEASDPLGRDCRIVDAGVIRLSAKMSIVHRLVELESELALLLDEHRPDVVAVEQLYAHYKHPRTAILMGHARGVILLVAQRRGTRLIELSANRVKQSTTGHGHASKSQMQRAIQLQFNLPSLPTPHDVADALAIALSAIRAR